MAYSLTALPTSKELRKPWSFLDAFFLVNTFTADTIVVPSPQQVNVDPGRAAWENPSAVFDVSLQRNGQRTASEHTRHAFLKRKHGTLAPADVWHILT
jgi:hypothetical protein